MGGRACRSCGRRFSGDARFCPFDGEPLEAARPESSAHADPLLGATVDGRYIVEAVLGEGGMGTVYRARHKSLGRGFALKIMRSDFAGEPELAERFTQEAKAAAAIAHPNVVEITDFGVLPSGVPYFVMELLVGAPLSRLLRKESFAIPRVLRIVRQIAEGLAAAHALGIVHRDLKPENVYIGAGDAVKLLDFGVAKIAGRSKLTRTGQVFGTPHYMSPEQASGQPVDQRSDIYSLGILMYEMLTGRVPFEADTFMGVVEKQIFATPEPPGRVCATGRSFGAIERVTMRCLQKRPEERYPNIASLLSDLGEASGGDEIELARRRRSDAPTPRWGTGSPAGERRSEGDASRKRGRAREDRAEPRGGRASFASMPAGLPRPLPTARIIVAGCAGGALVFALAAWWVLRGRPVSPSGDALVPPLSSGANGKAPRAGSPAVTAAWAAGAPPAGAVPAALASTGVAAADSAVPPVAPGAPASSSAAAGAGSPAATTPPHRSERPAQGVARGAHGSAGTGSTSKPRSSGREGAMYGGSEIINPWAAPR